MVLPFSVQQFSIIAHSCKSVLQFGAIRWCHLVRPFDSIGCHLVAIDAAIASFDNYSFIVLGFGIFFGDMNPRVPFVLVPLLLFQHGVQHFLIVLKRPF